MKAEFTFFSGGTALRSLSKFLALNNIFSVHIVSTFDSGGSTGVLRKAFNMPAIGDLRNRLLALADPQINPNILEFCSWRFPEKSAGLFEDLESFCKLSNPIWQKIPKEASHYLWLALHYFIENMPPNFDLAGACMGNLILTGIYLKRRRQLAAAMSFFEQLLQIKGVVIPVTDVSAHLACKLEDGTYVVGQHNFNKLLSPIKEVFLTIHQSADTLKEKADKEPIECHPMLNTLASSYLQQTRVVCYPMGSFYSSVLANLLTKGAAKEIAQSPAKKVFIPNSGYDDETKGHTVETQTKAIIKTLQKQMPTGRPTDFLQYVLMDLTNGKYDTGNLNAVKDLGIKIIDCRMIDPNDSKRHQSDAICKALFALSA